MDIFSQNEGSCSRWEKVLFSYVNFPCGVGLKIVNLDVFAKKEEGLFIMRDCDAVNLEIL